jgi:succinoglycan biosynthesis transport protein ExoP
MNTVAKANTLPSKQGFEAGLGGLEYYGLQDYKRLFLRRKWAILWVAFAFALVVSVSAYFWPNSYVARTAIMVEPGKVPDAYVRSTATIPAAQRLALLQQEILSDTRLSQVIDELGLYSNLQNTKTHEEMLAQMRKEIRVEPTSFTNLQSVSNPRAGLEAFTVSSYAQDPATAARVANRLASLFIEENMKAREQQVMGTAEFFDQQLEKAKEDLRAKGQKMGTLRARYFAELPESQNAHVQALANLQLEMRAEMDAISRAQQQKVYLQSLLADSPRIVDLDSTSAGQSDSVGLQEQMAKLQSQLDQYQSRYGPQYPDVLKIEAEIKRLQDQIKQSEKAADSSTAGSSVMGQAVTGHHNPVIESQIAALDQEVQKHVDREKELQSQINFYQSKLEGAPAILQQMAAATRDNDNAEQNFKDVQTRKFAADISSDVETRQKGERFVIVEPAQPPTRPITPNRLLIDGLALPAGLGLAILLALILEVLNTTVKTEREVTEHVRTALFAEIPWLITPMSKRRQRLRSALNVSGNTVLALAYFAVVFVSVR